MTKQLVFKIPNHRLQQINLLFRRRCHAHPESRFHPFYFQDDDDSSSSGEEGGSGAAAEPEPPLEPPQPPQPHVLAIAWSFFTTFFSSLIPQQPAAVNAN